MTKEKQLDIKLLGDFEIAFGDRQVSRLETRKATSLFANLVLRPGQMISRDFLAETFWGGYGEKNARKALRTDLWRIKRLLASLGADENEYLHCDKDNIGFNANAAFSVDVDIFQQTINPLLVATPEELTSQDARNLKNCARLYRGDLLQNDDSDWCALQRQELRALFLHVLELLMGYHERRHEWDRAIAYGHTLIRMDSLLEHIHFALMRCFAEKADRSTAIRYYQNLRSLLKNELGISPAPEIHVFYQRLVQGRNTAHDPAKYRSRDPRNEVRSALSNINTAAEILERLQLRL
ncbi:MAG: hypothetical protein OEV41_05780 [Gammaproteobacteria bacterium]|nr:hypothetical protein [Gammaproteobacteria bacterium]